MRGENRELFWPPQQLSNDVSVSGCVSHDMQGSRVRMSKQCDSAAGTTRHVNHWFSISVCKVAFEPQAVACLWKVFFAAVVVFSCQHVDSLCPAMVIIDDALPCHALTLPPTLCHRKYHLSDQGMEGGQLYRKTRDSGKIWLIAFEVFVSIDDGPTCSLDTHFRAKTCHA